VGAVPASVARDGEALVFRGVLDRAAVPAAWERARTLLDGARRLDLTALDAVDSAGLALLAELAGRLPGAAIDGAPAGFDELRAAYRLGPSLAFAG
jgi:phospholipid transport system transporter-binding protein